MKITKRELKQMVQQLVEEAASEDSTLKLAALQPTDVKKIVLQLAKLMQEENPEMVETVKQNAKAMNAAANHGLIQGFINEKSDLSKSRLISISAVTAILGDHLSKAIVADAWPSLIEYATYPKM